MVVSFSYASPADNCIALSKNSEQKVADEYFSNAMKICTTAIEASNDSEAYFWRGVLIYKYVTTNFSSLDYYNSNDENRIKIPSLRRRAIQDFSTVISRNPNDEQAYANRGVLYTKMTFYDLKTNYSEKAMADFDQAIKINPSYEWAYLNRGILYWHLKRIDMALDNLNMAIQLNPLFVEAYKVRARALREGAYDHCRALEDYRKIYELDSNTPNNVYIFARGIEECGCSNGADSGQCEISMRTAQNYYELILSLAPPGSFYWNKAKEKTSRLEPPTYKSP